MSTAMPFQAPTVPPAEKYKTDGGFDWASAFQTLLIGVVVGSIFGFLASLLGSYGFYFICLMPILMGLAVGYSMSKGIEFTKNRNPWVTATAAVLAGLAVSAAMHLTDYAVFQNKVADAPREAVLFALALKEFEAGRGSDMSVELKQAFRDPGLQDPETRAYFDVLQVETFPEYMHFEAEQGISIGSARRFNDKGINLGYTGTIIYWLVELLIVAGVAASMCWSQSTAPFCTQCDTWCRERLLGEVVMGGKQIAKALEQGKVTTLDRKVAEEGISELKLFRCDVCGSPDCSVVKVEDITWYNGQKQRTSRGKYVVTDETLTGLVATLDRSDDDHAVLHAIEELSEELRQVRQTSDVHQPTAAAATDQEEHDQAMRDYVAKLTS